MLNRKNPFFSRLIELIAFLIAFTILSSCIMNTLIIKGTPTGSRLYSVYKGYAKNTDVLIVGSSHAVQLSGREIWKNYGIPTFTIGDNSQPVDIMYHSIIEFLRYEKPKVIMVETALIPDDSITDPNTDYTGKPENDATFKYSLNYLNMVLHQIKTFDLPMMTDGIQLIYKWPLMHDRYNALKKDDVKIQMPYISTDMDPIRSVPNDTVEIITTDKREPLSPVGEVYLNKIIKLCKKKKINLVLFHTPYPAPELSMAQQNTISDIAAQNGVPFIDFNYLTEEIGFNPSTDQAQDLNHINYQGSVKVSNYLGSYLSENYNLEDHRNDPAYKNWDYDLEAWNDACLKTELEANNDISRWRELLSERFKDYVVIVTLSGNYTVEQDGIIQGILGDISAPEDFYSNGGALIIDHGKVLFCSDDTIYSFIHRFKHSTVSVKRILPNEDFIAEAPFENINDEIYLDGENYIKAINGMNVTIYNDKLGYVLDSVGIDAYISNNELFREKIKYDN